MPSTYVKGGTSVIIGEVLLAQLWIEAACCNIASITKQSRRASYTPSLLAMAKEEGDVEGGDVEKGRRGEMRRQQSWMHALSV